MQQLRSEYLLSKYPQTFYPIIQNVYCMEYITNANICSYSFIKAVFRSHLFYSIETRGISMKALTAAYSSFKCNILWCKKICKKYTLAIMTFLLFRPFDCIFYCEKWNYYYYSGFCFMILWKIRIFLHLILLNKTTLYYFILLRA